MIIQFNQKTKLWALAIEIEKHLNFHATIYPASFDQFDLKRRRFTPNSQAWLHTQKKIFEF